MTAALVAIAVAAVAAVTAVLYRRRRRPVQRPIAIDPFVLSEPWRRHVSAAQASQRRYREIVAATAAGPLRSNMESITRQVQRGVEECWLIAKRGDELDTALGRLDSTSLQARLEHTTDEATRGSLQAQLDPPSASGRRATTPTNDCACSTPASVSSSPKRPRSASALTQLTSSAALSTTSSRNSSRCASPSKTSTTHAREALVRRPLPREQPAALERHRCGRHGGVAHHRAGAGGGRRDRARPGPGQPTPTTRPTTPPTSIYELLLGGVLSATLVPLFTALARGRRRRGNVGSDLRRRSSCWRRSPLSAVLAAPLHLPAVLAVTVEHGRRRPVPPRSARRWHGSSSSRSSSTASTPSARRCCNARRRFFAAAWAPVLSTSSSSSPPCRARASWTPDPVSSTDVLDNEPACAGRWASAPRSASP